MDTILVANAGSSSVKFQLFGVEQDGSLKRQIKGQMDGIGICPNMRATAPDGSVLVDRSYENDSIPDVATALATVGTLLRDDLRNNPTAIKQHNVHGGPEYDKPVRVDQEVVAR